MKVLHIALNYAGSRQVALEKALQSLSRHKSEAKPGEYRQFDWWSQERNLGNPAMNVELLKLVREYQPDFTFIQTQGDVLSDSVLAAIPGFTLNWNGDVRAETPAWMVKKAHLFGVTCFSNMRDVRYMKEKCGIDNVDHLQIGYDEGIYNDRGIKNKSHSIVFLANNYKEDTGFPLTRFRYMAARAVILHGGLVRGAGWDPHEFKGIFPLNNQPHEAAFYNASEVGLSINHFQIERYFSDRLLRIMGSGCCALQHWYEGITEDFGTGDLEVFHTLDEMNDKIKWLLEHPHKREQIAAAGYKRVSEQHTWQARVRDMVQLLEKYG